MAYYYSYSDLAGSKESVFYFALKSKKVKVKGGGKMTPKQKAFADEYLVDMNATRAYKTVYKSVKKDETARAAGARLLANVNVRAYVDEKLEEISSNRIAKVEEIMEFLTSIVRGEIAEQTLIGKGGGEQGITSIEVTAKDRIKAAELLGKRYRAWDGESEDGPTGKTIIVADIKKMKEYIDES